MKRNRMAIWLLYTVAAGFAANAQDAAIHDWFRIPFSRERSQLTP